MKKASVILLMGPPFGLLVGCSKPEPAPRVAVPKEENPPAMVVVTPSPPPPPPEPSCEDRMETLAAGAQAPLASYQSALPHIVLRARTLPVIYRVKPKRSGNPRARQISEGLSEGRIRIRIRKIKTRYINDKAFLREIFLSEGYFFDDRREVAPSLIKEITLPDLFDAPTIYRLRRGGVEALTLRDSEYFDENGERAALLLNDRVSETPEALRPPLHFDIDEVRRRTGALRVRPMTVGESAAAVELVLPDGEVRPALLSVGAETTTVTCIGGDPETLAASLARAEAFWAQQRRIVAAAERLVSERTMFDEPKDELEDVQEDGDLRLEWTKAYMRRKKTFLLREVEYPVYDRKGNPTPPQVCVDFIFDTWERSFGTWYRKRKESPGRNEGDVDFSLLPDFSRRYIATVLAYAGTEGTPFDRYDIPRRRWVPFEKRNRFSRNLARQSDAIREGDALIIHGLREEDMAEHYHSVLVLETDPLTGIPTLVADNQGRPRIWSLAQAMQPAPKRSIKYRIRVDFDEMKALTRTLREQRILAQSVAHNP